MRLIQPLKFRTLKTGYFKMPRLQTPHLQTAVFQMGITVAFGLSVNSFEECEILPSGNCYPRLENSRLQTGRLQTGHFEMPRFQFSELQRLD